MEHQDVLLGAGAEQGSLGAPGAQTPPTQLTTMADYLDSDLAMPALTRGEVRRGIIMRVAPGEVLVDIGFKSEGVIAGKELERIDPALRSQLREGEELLVYVVSPEDRNGNILLSLARAQEEQDWHEAEELLQSQAVYHGTVAGYNKGGLLVKIGKVRGFVPASQLHPSRRKRGDEAPEERWAAMVGEAVQVKVIEVDRGRNRLILSERAAMKEWRESQKERLLAELKEGDVRKGTVISLTDFGAFVDLGGADGLVHLSELSWKRVSHPKDLLRVGQEVEAYVLHVDHERKRIGLSLRRLESDPWSSVDRRYRIGQLVEGTITKLAKFGAFARLSDDPEIEGLIHISELSEGHIQHPREAVNESQVVTLRIIRIDVDKRRMGLSLKGVASASYADSDWRAEGEAEEPGIDPAAALPVPGEGRGRTRRESVIRATAPGGDAFDGEDDDVEEDVEDDVEDDGDEGVEADEFGRHGDEDDERS
jgi:small subunit ribosomal protein S1